MFSSGLTRNFFRPSRQENCCSSAWPHSRDSRSRPRRRFFAQMQSSTNLARPRRSAPRGSRRSRGRRGRWEVGSESTEVSESTERKKNFLYFSRTAETSCAIHSRQRRTQPRGSTPGLQSTNPGVTTRVHPGTTRKTISSGQ